MNSTLARSGSATLERHVIKSDVTIVTNHVTHSDHVQFREHVAVGDCHGVPVNKLPLRYLCDVAVVVGVDLIVERLVQIFVELPQRVVQLRFKNCERQHHYN